MNQLPSKDQKNLKDAISKIQNALSLLRISDPVSKGIELSKDLYLINNILLQKKSEMTNQEAQDLQAIKNQINNKLMMAIMAERVICEDSKTLLDEAVLLLKSINARAKDLINEEFFTTNFRNYLSQLQFKTWQIIF